MAHNIRAAGCVLSHVPNTRDVRTECPTCRAHLTAVVDGGGHVSPGQWSAFLEHRASRGCQTANPIRRRAPRRKLLRQRVYA